MSSGLFFDAILVMPPKRITRSCFMGRKMTIYRFMTFFILSCITIGWSQDHSLPINPSFEEDGDWHVEGDGGISQTNVYGPMPDGKRLMNFRKRVWQDTRQPLQCGQEWTLDFHAASYGARTISVEWLAVTPDGKHSLLSRDVFHFPANQLWAFRPDVPPEQRKMLSFRSNVSIPNNGLGTLAIAFQVDTGFAGLDAVKLTASEPPVLHYDGTPADMLKHRFMGSQWLGNDDFGIVWKDRSPCAIAIRVGHQTLVKEWKGGVFWRVLFDSREGFTNIEAEAPRITQEGNTWVLKWNHQGVGLSVTVTPRDLNRLAFVFAVINHSGREIMSLALPVGWPEVIRSQGEWIIPAWIGAGIPMHDMKPLEILYPGQLHSQWFGFQDKAGFSWMLHTEDTTPCTKFLSLSNDLTGYNQSIWRHDLYLEDGDEYLCSYPTVLTVFPKGDWNDMAKHYRAWAMTAPWYLPLEKKTAARPQLDQLRNGWSWLRGMPPVKEVKGRRCDTTYTQALECMAEFRRRLRLEPMFWYTGWYGPFDSMYPQFFPVAPEMQGDIEDFATEVKRKHYFVTLHLNGAEYNEAADVFDKKKMARWRGRFYANSYGDDHKNYVVSYPCVLPEMLRYTRRLGGELGMNIYYDVMGHVYAHDDNPDAGYAPNTLGRSNWNLAKNAAWKALREAVPHTYFQTEGCAECAIPYVDAPSGGSTTWVLEKGHRPLPLWQLVYGDTGFYLPLYDGGGQLNCSRGFTLTPLFGIIQQLPQDLWKTLDPFWLYISRRQRLAGQQAGEELLKYENDGDICRSFWKEAATVAFGSDHATCQITIPWNGEKIVFHGFGVSPEFKKRGGGSVAIINRHGLSADAVQSVTSSDGRLLWQSPDARLSVVLYDRTATIFNGTAEEISGLCRIGGATFNGSSKLRRWNFAEARWEESPSIHSANGTLDFALRLPPGQIVEFQAE